MKLQITVVVPYVRHGNNVIIHCPSCGKSMLVSETINGSFNNAKPVLCPHCQGSHAMFLKEKIE